MSPRFVVVMMALAACSAAPQPREAPNRAQPVVSVDAGTVHDAVVDDEWAVNDGPLVCEPFEWKNPACRNDPRMCTEGGAYCKCPSPPDVESPACWATMPCPAPPDPRVRACRAMLPPCPDDEHWNPDNPNCIPSTVMGRVIEVRVSGTKTVVTVGVGAAQGVAVRWRGTLLRGDSEDALPGGELTIVRVDQRATVGTVRLPVKTVQANGRVRFDRR